MKEVTVTVEYANGLLMGRWGGLRDSATTTDLLKADEYLFAFWQLGIVDDLDVDGWKARFRRCPGHINEGGRVWCAYCGDIDPQRVHGCEKNAVALTLDGWVCADCKAEEDANDIDGRPTEE